MDSFERSEWERLRVEGRHAYVSRRVLLCLSTTIGAWLLMSWLFDRPGVVSVWTVLIAAIACVWGALSTWTENERAFAEGEARAELRRMLRSGR
jgi:Flp pilus assembly protein TadB